MNMQLDSIEKFVHCSPVHLSLICAKKAFSIDGPGVLGRPPLLSICFTPVLVSVKAKYALLTPFNEKILG